MLMPMMQIRIVRVLVAQGPMPMPVRVRSRYRNIVMVLMMRVVNVAVFMLQGFVLMFMLVSLGEVQINAECHQGVCTNQLHAIGSRITGCNRT